MGEVLPTYIRSYFWMDRELIEDIQDLAKDRGAEHVDAVMAEYDKIVERAGKIIAAGFDDFKKQARAAYKGVRAEAAMRKIDNVWRIYNDNHRRLIAGRDALEQELKKKVK